LDFLPVAFIKKRSIIRSTGEQLKPPEPAHKSLTPFQYPKFERIAQSHNASIRPIDVPAGFSHPKEYHLGFHTNEHGNQTVTLFLLPQHVSKGIGHVDYSDFEKAHDSLKKATLKTSGPALPRLLPSSVPGKAAAHPLCRTLPSQRPSANALRVTRP